MTHRRLVRTITRPFIGHEHMQRYYFCLEKSECKAFYYIDTRVFLENIPLVKFIKQHPGPEWFIFHNLTREFIDDVISVISLYFFIDVFLSI